ncbi:uncharacterized protein LOC126682804 [Mercurialis annua]|uniref:uncharacterized protein LOC126682804 n=1 Tax=Mercurialis annua TaxID=3986 RepID=UPI00215DF089|nr:uncharacterized protein LOC126682804 [Mercurialis annua]
MNNFLRRNDDDDEKGLLWKLPEVRFKEFGKLGPAFGLGAGCGVGFGIGLVGGIGLGPGIPGLQMGIGFGAGCGIGYGFGYGVGKGVAHDDKRRYSNVGNLFHSHANHLPTQDEIASVIDELVINTKKLVKATSREIEKWRK